MEELLTLFQKYDLFSMEAWLIVAGIAIIGLMIYNIVLTGRLNTVSRKLSVLTKGSDSTNVAELFEKYFHQIDQLSL